MPRALLPATRLWDVAAGSVCLPPLSDAGCCDVSKQLLSQPAAWVHRHTGVHCAYNVEASAGRAQKDVKSRAGNLVNTNNTHLNEYNNII